MDQQTARRTARLSRGRGLVPISSTGFQASGNIPLGNLQAAYRPSKLAAEWAKNLEFVIRRDALLQPEGPPESTDERRWTLGANYWLSSSTALKAAYDFGHRTEKGEPSEIYRGLRLQAVMGF